MSATMWCRWIVGFVLLAASAWLICLNAAVAWRLHVVKAKAPSWIPLLGGCLGVLAAIALPVTALNRWWWVPLVLDWGCLLGIADTIIFHIQLRLNRKSK